jgi:hypothetical protein
MEELVPLFVDSQTTWNKVEVAIKLFNSLPQYQVNMLVQLAWTHQSSVGYHAISEMLRVGGSVAEQIRGGIRAYVRR